MMLSDVCQCLTSVTYIGPKSRTERPRKTKIGTEVAHVTCDSYTTFKVERSRSPGHFAHRRVGASCVCSSGCRNMLAVGNCCYVAVCSVAQGASVPTGEKGRGHIVAAAHLQLVIFLNTLFYDCALSSSQVQLCTFVVWQTSNVWHHWYRSTDMVCRLQQSYCISFCCTSDLSSLMHIAHPTLVGRTKTAA